MPAAGSDDAFMAAALALAARNVGDTWPNPAVGCVLARDGVIVGRGWTQSGGRPHAETEALRRAGSAARGATAYVTLEPCSHHGQTPPCADALIAAGIRRVVVAATDRDPKVSGQGLAKLRAAGLDVVEGVGKATAEQLNAGFFLRVQKNRPLFALKVAATLDGRIALPSGDSKWITGEAARLAGHALRARYDAILVGSGTVLADDPMLTCRLEGYAGRPKVRIVLDRRGRVPVTSKLLTTKQDIPTWVLQHATPEALANHLAEQGLTCVLIEGGGAVSAAFLKAELVDQIAWFRAPSIMGGSGLPAIGEGLSPGTLDALPSFHRQWALGFGADCLEVFARRLA